MSSSHRIPSFVFIVALACILLFSMVIVVFGSTPAVVPAVKMVHVISPTGLSGDPGDNVSYIFHIQNTGSETDRYNYSIASNRTSWNATPVNGVTLSLAPGSTCDVNVTHHIDPNATAWEKSGLTLTTWSSSIGFAVNDTGYTLTTSNPLSSVAVAPPSPAETTAYPGDKVELKFTVTNRGNWDDTFDMVVNTQYGWIAQLDKTLQISRGESQSFSVVVAVPAFNPTWSESDFAKNGTFYNSKGMVTLTATSQFMPVRASASARIRVMPFYQAGLKTVWDKASVDYYKTSSDNVRNTAEYLLIVSNMNNLPTTDTGTAEVTLSITAPIPTKSTPRWSSVLDPPCPYLIEGRDRMTVKLIVTEPPGQDSGEYFTRMIAYIKPQPGRVSDPEKNMTYPANVTTIVGIQGAVDVLCTIPGKSENLTVSEKYVYINYTVNNYGSGQDTFLLNGTTTHGWKTGILNGTEYLNPASVTISRNHLITVTMRAEIPDNVNVGAVENITLKATSTLDSNHPSDNDSCALTIMTLYRISVFSAGRVVPIAPGEPLDLNYTVHNLGSSKENVRISFLRSGSSSPKWAIPKDPVLVMIKPDSSWSSTFTVIPPADPAWHESLSIVIKGEIVNSIGGVMYRTQANVTVEVRMLVTTYPDVRDEIAVPAVPGETLTFSLSMWNLAKIGKANVTAMAEGVPSDWARDCYFTKVNSSKRLWLGVDSGILDQYKQLRFHFNLTVPKGAEERNNVVITISAQNHEDLRLQDNVTINVTLVVLDLSVRSVILSTEELIDDENVTFTAEISAGAGGVGISKDATQIEVIFTVNSDGSVIDRKIESVGTIPKGSSVNVSFSWTVPKLRWYERSKDYRITISVTSPDESVGANSVNNQIIIDKSASHKTIPAAVSVGIIVTTAVLLGIIYFIAKDFARLRTNLKLLVFVAMAALVGLLLGAIFLLPLGGAGLAVLFIILVLPIPATVVFFYLKTKSIVIGLVTGAIVPLVFGALVGAGSGKLEYIGSVFTEPLLSVPFAYSGYTGGIILMSVVVGFGTKMLWTRANNAILRVEMKIKDIKRTG